MTDTAALLDRLRDWIVTYDRAGKSAAEVERDMEAHNSELLDLAGRDAFSDREAEAYGVVMSMADARGLFDELEDLEP